MDSSGGSDEIISRFECLQWNSWNRAQLPGRMPISGLHRATLEGDLPKVRRLIESGESVNKREPHCNCTPLHMAVIYNNLEMLDYLLAQEGVEVDAKSCEGKTPLHVAASLDHVQSVERLIKAGCDVNISDNYGDTPLHVSISCLEVCRLLIRNGAVIRTNNSEGTALHEALEDEDLEVLHMLLYYNVDANDLDENGCTPFMLAVAQGNVEAQEILLEYVDDFNRFSNDPTGYGVTMSFALQTDSPFIKDMLERGADVNYGDHPLIRDENCAFSSCLQYDVVNVSTFKMVWERLRYNDSKNTIDLLLLFGWHKVVVVPTFLEVIIESDNFEVAVQFFSKGENYFLFVNKFAEGKFDLEQLTALTCRLLEHGFRASSYDVHAIFSHYGYCELFRILLYMDNDFSRGWLPHMALTRLIFDVNYNLKSIAAQVNDILKATVVQLLECSICPRLIDILSLQYNQDESMSAILRRLPRVPSLIELARNAARKQIWQSPKITSICQFYTTIDYLDVPSSSKKVLTFTRKIYMTK